MLQTFNSKTSFSRLTMLFQTRHF